MVVPGTCVKKAELHKLRVESEFSPGSGRYAGSAAGHEIRI